MNTAAMMLADKGGMLDNLSPAALFFASLGLMAIAGVLYLINKKLFEEDSFLLEIAAFACGLAGVVGLFNALFGG